MRPMRFALLIPMVVLAGAMPSRRAPEYTRIYTLSPKEGVFAYARIAPDARMLVYASEQLDPRRPDGISTSETVVDLASRTVIYTEEGIDAYWSTDGTRIIYSGTAGVSIRHMNSGTVAGNVAPGGLGDYYSWASRDGKDLILTIASNYYYLDGDKAVLPYAKVASCPGIGTGDRPLISKDGRRISTFVRGNVVVRGLDNCDNIIDTGIQGAKADFSWDGRYIAFHAVRPDTAGYEIKIVDLEQRTVRTLPGLKGSALFPSWTRDGRLCFRYDGPDYRGFMLANNVLDIPAVPLGRVSQQLPGRREWSDVFPSAPMTPERFQVVLIWAPWSAHSQIAFTALGQARSYFARHGAPLRIAQAADPGSSEADITRQLGEFGVTIPRLPITAPGLLLTEARNQMPTTLLFRDGVLVDRRLGAQSFDQLREWIETTQGEGRKEKGKGR
jgi:hypothetical protein